MIEHGKNHIVFLFLILLSASCTNNEKSYFPLNKGYKWQYDVALITRDGLLNQKYIFNNLGQRELNGEPVYLRQSIDGSVSYYSATEEGTYYLGNIQNKSLPPEFQEYRQVILPKDISVGTEWEDTTITKLLKKTGPPQKTVFKIIAEVPLDVKVESLNETVTVPAGHFENCLKISMEGFVFKNAGNYVGLTMVSVEQTNWYAPGVGLVKLERLETTEKKALDKGTLLVELTNFKSG
jgi:hypothetical protein